MQNIEHQPAKFEKILQLQEKKSTLTTKCCLKGPWYDTMVEIGDIVSVQGVYNQERRIFIVSADFGLIVTNPDTLMSATSVVNSLFCARKTALSERFKVGLGDVKMVMLLSLIKVLKFNWKSILDARW